MKKLWIVIVACIVALEVVSAVFMNIYTRKTKNVKAGVDLVAYWEYDPYLLWAAKQGVSGFDRYSSYTMNNFAFRNDYPVSKDRKPGTFRVIVLGGSVAWGTGASSNKTVWTAVAQELLQRDDLAVEVLNAGCAGYISFQELMYLQFRLLEFSPDMIVVLDGYNDIFMSSLYDVNRYTPHTNPYYDMEKRFHALPLIFQIGGLIKERSAFFKLMKRIQEKILYERGKPMFPVSHLNTRGIDAYFSNVKSMADILRGRGIVTVFMLQPYIMESKKGLSADEERMAAKARQEAPVIKGAYQVVRQRYQDLANREHIAYYDLNGIFDRYDAATTVWFDHVHLNDNGHRVLGELLKDIISTHFHANKDR